MGRDTVLKSVTISELSVYSTPCFLFLEGISPQDLQIRIKRRELVWKAARISNFIKTAPFWVKINAKIKQNRDFLNLHYHLVFAKKKKWLYTPLFPISEGISPQHLQIRIKRRELVLKAVRISNFIPPAPHWWKIKAKFSQNYEIQNLHCHLLFIKKMRTYISQKN